MYSNGFLPLINKPTRITDNTATIIDNIFTNDIHSCLNMYKGILINDISDHLPIFVICNNSFVRKSSKLTKNIRQLKEVNLNRLKNLLSVQNWNSVINSEDINVCYKNFVNTFNNVYNECCPVKTVVIKNVNKDKAWFTNGLRNACSKKNVLYKNFLRNRTKRNEDKYKRYKNMLTSILRHCEKAYYNKQLLDHKNDIKGTWQVLNSIIKKRVKCSEYPDTFVNNGKSLDKKKDIANGFNDFFTNIGPSLSNKIAVPDNTNIYQYLQNKNPNTIFLCPVDECEVINTVNNFKNKQSNDCNDINMSLLKNVITSIVYPLTFICNKSFKDGIFPEDMKIARIIPLYKAGDKNVFTNYRPVSLLPQFSKLLEKLFSIRFDSFLDKFKILSENQYGFRKNRSTSDALLELVEKVTNAVDQKKYTVGVFIDLKKAFDTIDHSLLLKKLEFYGVRGIALKWLTSYLGNRKQYVDINGELSMYLTVLCGVPQGSILGPKLFILYINDICNISNILDMILFADDTNIFCTDENIISLSNKISEELSKLNVWFAVNKLSLNISKTNYMIFCSKSIPNNINIRINDRVIERVPYTKFLGVIVDEKLNWKEHISKVKNKTSKSLAIINKVKSLLNIDALKSLYYALFLPYINYCLEIWGSSNESNLQCIFKLQKNVVRLICNKGRREHTNSLFYKLKIIKFFDLRNLKICTVVHRAINQLLSLNLIKLLNLEVNNTVFYTRNRNKLKHKFVRTKKKSFCISVIGVRLYNNLQENIINCKNIKCFVKLYKLDIINNYIVEY